MKNQLRCAALSLVLLLLAACQTAPAPIGTPASASPAGNAATGDVIGFFKDDPQRSLSIALPLGWVAKFGGQDARAPIVVTDDWERYEKKELDKEALGIIVSPLTDSGAPEEILTTVTVRLGEMLTERQGEIVTSQHGEHKIAWVEYTGTSVDDGTPVRYLLAVVARDQRSVFAFTSVLPDQVESVRPKFQEIVNGITLR